MVFTSVDFIVYFIVLIIGLYLIKNQTAKKIIILVASYFFYGYWDYRFLSLIIFSTLVDYLVGKNLDCEKDESKRKIYLVISIIVNLGLLGFFKYYNFFIETFSLAFGMTGNTLNIILPIGISFYTFQTISYSIDVYRRKLKHTESFLEFSIFVAFFPQLVAGPIVRAIDFLPQIKKDIQLNKQQFVEGGQIFLTGVIKKILIADRVAYYVDLIFKNPELYSSGSIWLGVVAYSLQIYFDFCGYSDMAIGLAKILGFDLTKNFDLPYISLNPTEFWRRWHISLSSWLKDYLYISLGGNRKGKLRQQFNLFLTMLLGGLWHGASINFVVWGMLHGIGLIVHKQWLKVKESIWFLKNEKLKPLRNIIAWLLNFAFIATCWVFFRAVSFGKAFVIIKKMYSLTQGVHYYYIPVFVIIPIVIIGHIYKIRNNKSDYYILKLETFRGQFILVMLLLALFYLYPVTSQPFIYFQF